MSASTEESGKLKGDAKVILEEAVHHSGLKSVSAIIGTSREEIFKCVKGEEAPGHSEVHPVASASKWVSGDGFPTYLPASELMRKIDTCH